MNNITKNALEESLKKFLLQKPLDKITISDLTTDCGISRMAFYYHFKDIYDLVEWSCIEDASRALQGKKTYDTWQEGLQHGLRDHAWKCWEFPAEYGEGRAIKIKFIRKIRDNYGIAALMLKVRDIKYSKSTLQSKADDKFFVIRLVL